MDVVKGISNAEAQRAEREERSGMSYFPLRDSNPLCASAFNSDFRFALCAVADSVAAAIPDYFGAGEGVGGGKGLRRSSRNV